jgi:hypothetical protein
MFLCVANYKKKMSGRRSVPLRWPSRPIDQLHTSPTMIAVCIIAVGAAIMVIEMSLEGGVPRTCRESSSSVVSSDTDQRIDGPRPAQRRQLAYARGNLTCMPPLRPTQMGSPAASWVTNLNSIKCGQTTF